MQPSWMAAHKTVTENVLLLSSFLSSSMTLILSLCEIYRVPHNIPERGTRTWTLNSGAGFGQHTQCNRVLA